MKRIKVRDEYEDDRLESVSGALRTITDEDYGEQIRVHVCGGQTTIAVWHRDARGWRLIESVILRTRMVPHVARFLGA